MRLEMLENDNLALANNAETYKLQVDEARQQIQIQSSSNSNIKE